MVHWTAPASSGSSAVNSYRITASAGAANQSSTVGSVTTGQVAGLKGNTLYCAQVQAINAAGAGPLSVNNNSPSDCATTSNDKPGTVAKPTATSGAGSVAVRWSPPALGPFNTAIASYTVVASPRGGGSATTDTVTGSTSDTVTKLAAGKTYDLSVYATNASGNKGDASSPTAATTDDAPQHLSITVDATNDGQLTATWKPPSVNNGQTITYKATIGGTSVTPSGNKAVFDRLGAQRYTITVTATSSGGSTASTQSATPWVRIPLYECYSPLKGNHYIEPRSDCGQLPQDSQQIQQGQAPFKWPGSPAPGAVTLYFSYGTTTGGNANSGSHYWYTSNPNPPSSSWVQTDPGGATGLVWTSAASAPSGAYHICEALVSAGATSYYQLFLFGQQPSSCVAQFWG